MTDPLNTLLDFSPTTTLGELLEAAKHYNAGQVQMVVRNVHDTAIAAVIVVRGDWTKDVLDAIDKLEKEDSVEEDDRNG